MQTVLFYVANGVGLGHLRRTSLIVKELRSRNLKIILVTSACSPQIFGKFYNHLVHLIPLSDKLLGDSCKIEAAGLTNSRKFTRVLKKFKPDLIIADFYLTSLFSYDTFSYALDRFPVKSIFIWRLAGVDSFCHDLENETVKLSYFQKIIFPHNYQELKDLWSRSLLRYIESDSKFAISGPICRKINKNKIIFCREKYKILFNDFLITMTVGAGGQLNKVRVKSRRCEGSIRIIKDFLAVYPRLVKKIPNVRVIIIVGPYGQNFSRKLLSGVKIVKFEENLPELLYLSKLVISTVGYNTCNELIAAKIPSVLVPLWRGGREQHERADYLEKKSIARVYSGGSRRQFLSLILDCKDDLDGMKYNFKKFSGIKSGNKKVAKIILNMLK